LDNIKHNQTIVSKKPHGVYAKAVATQKKIEKKLMDFTVFAKIFQKLKKNNWLVDK